MIYKPRTPSPLLTAKIEALKAGATSVSELAARQLPVPTAEVIPVMLPAATCYINLSTPVRHV